MVVTCGLKLTIAVIMKYRECIAHKGILYMHENDVHNLKDEALAIMNGILLYIQHSLKVSYTLYHLYWKP